MHERVHDAFLDSLTRRAREVHAGTDAEAKLGPMTLPAQVDVVRRHIDDALARGGRAVVGGPEAVGDRFVQPTVLTDVPPDSTAITEETFAPDRDRHEGRATWTRRSTSPTRRRYGLGSTVFSGAVGRSSPDGCGRG